MVIFKHRHTTFWLFVIFSIPLFLSLFSFASKIESMYSPVVSNMNAVLIQRNDASLVYHVVGEKKRSCSVESLKAYTTIDGFKVKLPAIEFIAEGNADVTTRPVGVHDFGYWKINVSILPEKPPYIEVFVEHNCGAPWKTLTSLGRWDT